MRTSVLIAAMLLAGAVDAPAQESPLQAEWRIEREHIKEDCSAITTFAGCAATLVTDHPVHVSLGSIAPQNGFGFGPALVTHYTPNENWRINWDSDAVFAPGGAWRAGTYFRGIRTHVELPQVVTSGTATAGPRIHEYPVFNAYGQVISLHTISYYGLGRSSSRANQTRDGMREAIFGGNAILPVGPDAINLSLLLELNGRLFDIRSGSGDAPEIQTRFSEATAPGLSNQPAYAQPGEGIRFRPSLANGHLNLSYMFQLQQFVASSQSEFSFRRWTVDLVHEIPLYRTSAPVRSRDTNGPNSCFAGPTSETCPPITRDRWGTVSLRFLTSKSGVGSGSVVPFYLQRTIGGSDVNGNRILASYDDYRFRAPHVMFLQETLEHSIYGPVGFIVAAEQGNVALQQQELTFAHALRSYGAGLTLRAGGFPAVIASWATGPEGHHIAVTMDTSLLGGGSRPSLH
jgi:hypothetical protein